MTYRVNGQTVTKEAWDAKPSKMDWSKCQSAMVHSTQPFVSPIDGKVISSKAGLRAHEREHKVIQAGNEYVGIVNEKRAAAKEAAHEKKVKDDYNFKWQ